MRKPFWSGFCQTADRACVVLRRLSRSHSVCAAAAVAFNAESALVRSAAQVLALAPTLASADQAGSLCRRQVAI
eukprot:4806041-Pleurochrysis_carterae.AAC.2